MTYKDKSSINSQTLKVNKLQKIFKNFIENKIFHVIIFYEKHYQHVISTEMSETNGAERSHTFALAKVNVS